MAGRYKTRLHKAADWFTIGSSALLVMSILFPQTFTVNILPLEVAGTAQAPATPIYLAWVFGVLVLAGIVMKFGKRLGIPL